MQESACDLLFKDIRDFSEVCLVVGYCLPALATGGLDNSFGYGSEFLRLNRVDMLCDEIF